MRIAKTFSFEAAHILDLPYESKCKSLHGHSYRVKVVLEGEPNEVGMLFDYTQFPKTFIDQLLDHKLLVSNRHLGDHTGDQSVWDVEVGRFSATLPGSMLCVMDVQNTTAEEIARWLFDQIADWLRDKPGTAQLASVKVSETEATAAQYP